MPAERAERPTVTSDASTRDMFDVLLDLQERDLAIDRLVHRRDTLPEQRALESVDGELATLQERLRDTDSRRDTAVHEEQRFDAEAGSIEEKATEVERRMYSGEVTSPRELQTMQADVDSLRRHRRSLEDRELEVMEQRETIDSELAELRSRAETLDAESTRLRDVLASEYRVIDAELDVERKARDELVGEVSSDLLAEYERCRRRARGVGAARLVGTTCQGCHLSIPSVEAERIRKAPPGTIAHCDNCGCLLVP